MDLTDDPLAGVDASELEADIDKAIDELFVKKGDAPEPSLAEEVPPEEPAEKPLDKPAEEPIVTPTPEDPLAQLKESLLTLDWEITSESIQAFEKELQAIGEKLSEDRHSMAVIKMSLGVVQYLRAVKGSAAPISIQFLHGAIRGLDIFVREPAPTDAERSEVMDKLLGQFRRVKAEIQRIKPTAAPEPAEEPELVEPEPPVEPEPFEEPFLEEIAAEESVLEDVIEEEPLFEEIIEDEAVLEDVTAVEPVAAAPAEEEVAQEELIGEEPILEELPSEEAILAADLEEEPILEEPAEEEPWLEEPAEEEPWLEEPTVEEPTLAAPADEEPILEDLFGEEPAIEELAEEEPTLAPPAEEEPAVEELFGEELGLDEIPEEEPVLEPTVAPAEIPLIPEVESAEIPESLQHLLQEARDQSGQLSDALAALTEASGEFFGRILRAMAGKPALEKLEKYFGSAHETIEARLTTAQELSGNLGATLTKLEQNLGQQQVEAVTSGAQVAIDSQVRTIRAAVQSISQAVSNLQQSLPGEAAAPAVSHEGIAFEDAQLDTEEFALESEEIMESLDSEPVLDLVEEIPSEPPSTSPGAPATIYLADVANNTLGIPTEAVANVFKVSKRKAKGLRKRGFVKLSDFKGTFSSIKRGITGPLAKLKPKELKKIQFPIITPSPEILGTDDTEAVAPVRGIVLLSTGARHGTLFTDEVMQKTPYDVKGYRKAGLPVQVSGTATIEGDFEINIIDPDYLLS